VSPFSEDSAASVGSGVRASGDLDSAASSPASEGSGASVCSGGGVSGASARARGGLGPPRPDSGAGGSAGIARSTPVRVPSGDSDTGTLVASGAVCFLVVNKKHKGKLFFFPSIHSRNG